MHVEFALASLRTWVDSRGAVGVVTFGAVYVALVLLLVPGAVPTLAAGALFGLPRGVVIVAIATSVADAVAFLAARYVGRGAVERLAARYPRARAVDLAVARAGWRIVALLRLNPAIPYSASNYLFGATGVAFLPYLVTSGIFHAARHHHVRLSRVRRSRGGRGARAQPGGVGADRHGARRHRRWGHLHHPARAAVARRDQPPGVADRPPSDPDLGVRPPAAAPLVLRIEPGRQRPAK